MRKLKIILIAATLLICALLGAGAAVLLAAAGSPTWTVALDLPGRLQAGLKVEPLLRAASSEWGMRLLHGTTWHSRIGTLKITRNATALQIDCAPCTLHLSQFSATPISLSGLTLSVRRQGRHLDGTLRATASGTQRMLSFAGELSEQSLALQWRLAHSDIAGLLRMVGPALPEAHHAVVRGNLSASGTLRLPQRQWSMVPRLESLEVYGLGTERLRHGNFALLCRNADGSVARRQSGDGAPGWLPLKRMGRWLPRAVLAAEDARFHTHAGYDLDELLPLLANAERGTRRGASTITQQLAKNFFVGADGTGVRKLRELLYAVEMERTLGKRRILTLYLNTVDWGPGVCGAADAARFYFSRSPGALRASEAAWLGGILRNPHRAYRHEFMVNHVNRQRLAWVAKGMRHGRGKTPASGAIRFTPRHSLLASVHSGN